ncbi:hypothetical protein Barb4_01441 [Bacteroidales bacterium Barb4]|nr:hypothetical protein Barb4_01441 [Bacteroidales bacterium Barb4]
MVYYTASFLFEFGVFNPAIVTLFTRGKSKVQDTLDVVVYNRTSQTCPHILRCMWG